MCGDITQPIYTGGLHGGIGIQALGDGVGDDRLALFLQQLDQPSLLCHQPVDLPRLPIEKCNYFGLL